MADVQPSNAAPVVEGANVEATTKTDAPTDTKPTDAKAAPADKGTIADAPESADKPVAAPADWPEDWRQRLAGKDEKLLARLNRFQSLPNVWKSYLSLEQRLASGELKAALKDGATEAEVAEHRKANGIPEKVEGYYEHIKLADGLVIGEEDKPALNAFLETALAKNLPPAAVNDVVGWYFATQDKAVAAQDEADLAAKRDNDDALRAEWGVEYRANINAIGSLLDGAPEGMKANILGARLADGTLLGNSADALRWLAGLSRELNPAATVVSSGAPATAANVEARIAEIKKMMPDGRSAYWTDPGIQEEYRRLLTTRERLSSRAA